MTKNTDFILRYANCWEDADLLLQQIYQFPDAKYLSIISGGENTLSLLTLQPSFVCAVDVNPIQCHLLALKVAAIKLLSRNEYLGFAGYTQDAQRWHTYETIKKALPDATQKYWEEKKNWIDNGIIHCGRIEKNMRLFSKYFLPLIHSKHTCRQLIARKNTEEQKNWFEKYWNTKRYTTLIQLFFSKPVMKVLAPDPAFFEYVKESPSAYILSKISNHLQSTTAQENPILHYALFGEYGTRLPHYLQGENYETIRRHLDKLVIVNGYAEQPIKQYGPFDGFNLSNIFEYTTPAEMKILSQQFADGGRPGCRYVYWNLMLDRKISDYEKSVHNVLDSEALPYFQDKGFIYRACVVDAKK